MELVERFQMSLRIAGDLSSMSPDTMRFNKHKGVLAWPTQDTTCPYKPGMWINVKGQGDNY